MFCSLRRGQPATFCHRWHSDSLTTSVAAAEIDLAFANPTATITATVWDNVWEIEEIEGGRGGYQGNDYAGEAFTIAEQTACARMQTVNLKGKAAALMFM